ncbi:MAG: hypothetical protein ACE5LC_00405 [Candidatus Aminicenantales bacterium]
MSKLSRIFGLNILVILLIIGGSTSCGEKPGEETPQQEEAEGIKPGTNEIQGVVSAGQGQYFYIPGAQGIDMVIQGELETGDASTLAGKEVKVKGVFSPQRPSILTVDSIEIKEDEKRWKNIYTREEELVLEDYLDLKARDEFQTLNNLAYNKKEGWEGKEKAKVYGRLEKLTMTENEVEKEIYRIHILDEKGEEKGIILVDSITDFARYYLKKLRLFEKFWFYLKIKETVDWKVRRKTKELFHADLLFAGLF